MGKTQALMALKKLMPSWDVRVEPVKAWTHFPDGAGGTVNLLEDFYREGTEASFRKLQARELSPAAFLVLIFSPSQFAALNSLVNRYLAPVEPSNPVPVVYERSIRVAREVFLMRGAHLLSQVELELLRQTATVFESLVETNMPAVYLSCTQECMEKRVAKRGRPEEAFIT